MIHVSFAENFIFCRRFSERNDKHHALFENIYNTKYSFYIFIPTTFQLVMSEAYSVDHNIEIYNNKFLFTFSVHYSNIKKMTSFFNAKFCKNFVFKILLRDNTRYLRLQTVLSSVYVLNKFILFLQQFLTRSKLDNYHIAYLFRLTASVCCIMSNKCIVSKCTRYLQNLWKASILKFSI